MPLITITIWKSFLLFNKNNLILNYFQIIFRCSHFIILSLKFLFSNWKFGTTKINSFICKNIQYSVKWICVKHLILCQQSCRVNYSTIYFTDENQRLRSLKRNFPRLYLWQKVKSSFKPRLALFSKSHAYLMNLYYHPSVSVESHALTLIIIFIMFHHLCPLYLTTICWGTVMQVIRDSHKTQCSLFRFSTNWKLVLNIIMVLFSITYSTMFLFRILI